MVTGVVPHVGARPWGVAVDSRGRVITANGSSNDVAIIDPKTAAVTRRISVGESPWGVASYP